MKYRHPWTVNGMPPSLRSTSGLSTSPSLPSPASLLAETAKPHLHPMMHSSPGIPQSFTLRCSRSKASPHHGGLAAIGAERVRRAAAPFA